MNKKPIIFISVAMLASLSACSDVDSINETKSESLVAVTPSPKDHSIQLELKSSPLDKMEFLGLMIPEVKAASPCPYLSDEVALSLVKTSWVLKRRETSNESCFWSKNLGFSIKLTVEPLDSAKPVRERVYNLENPPVLKDQSEPGNNAVVLYDTTWDKERAYAISFEQDNKLVMIYVTGLKTDAQRLTMAAKKVASQLSRPIISASQIDNTDEFNMCSIWNTSEIEAIMGAPIRLTGSKDNCKWETGIDENLKQISVGIFYGKTYPWESVIADGANELVGIGERSVMIKQRKKGAKPGSVLLNTLYTERLVGVSVNDNIDNHKTIALALSKNIDKRLN